MPPPPPPRSPLLIAVGLVALLRVVLLQLDLIEYASERIGIGAPYVVAVLLASLLTFDGIFVTGILAVSLA